VSAQKAIVDTSVILRVLTADDKRKKRAAEDLLRNAKSRGISLYLPPVTVLETVWVLEKVYKLGRNRVAEIVEALLNTPEFRCDMGDVFRAALADYAGKNVKFADAMMAHWALDMGISVVYTYDEKDFKRIAGIEVRKP